MLHMERLQKKARDEEQKLERLTAEINANTAWINVQNADKTVEIKRRAREEERMQFEVGVVSENEMAIKEAERARLSAHQQQMLAKTMEEDKKKQELAMRKLKQICENSEELKELESKLKVAYMNKERAQQIANKSQISENEKRISQIQDANMEADRQRALLSQTEQLVLTRYNRIKTKEILQEQMRLKDEKISTEAKAQFQEEKGQVDSIVDAIRREDEKKAVDNQVRKEQIRSDEHQYLADRAKREEEIRQMQVIEDANIAKYAELKQERQGAITQKVEEVQRQLAERDQFLQDEAMRVQRQKDEEEELLNRYHYFKNEDHLNKLEEEMKQRKRRAVEEVKDANSMQMQIKEAKLRQLEEEENMFKSMMQDKYREDEKRDHENFEKRKEKATAYKAEIERLNTLKMQARRQEIERLDAEDAKEKMEEEMKKKIVEAERQKLLLSYATEVQDYLPKGIFSNQDDLQFVKNPSDSSSLAQAGRRISSREGMR